MPAALMTKIGVPVTPTAYSSTTARIEITTVATRTPRPIGESWASTGKPLPLLGAAGDERAGRPEGRLVMGVGDCDASWTLPSRPRRAAGVASRFRRRRGGRPRLAGRRLRPVPRRARERRRGLHRGLLRR